MSKVSSAQLLEVDLLFLYFSSGRRGRTLLLQWILHFEELEIIARFYWVFVQKTLLWTLSQTICYFNLKSEHKNIIAGYFVVHSLGKLHKQMVTDFREPDWRSEEEITSWLGNFFSWTGLLKNVAVWGFFVVVAFAHNVWLFNLMQAIEATFTLLACILWRLLPINCTGNLFKMPCFSSEKGSCAFLSERSKKSPAISRWSKVNDQRTIHLFVTFLCPALYFLQVLHLHNSCFSTSSIIYLLLQLNRSNFNPHNR